jgi:hypothetical protein
MSKPDDLSKPLVALDHDSTLVCVIEMSGSSWLVAATVPPGRPLRYAHSLMGFYPYPVQVLRAKEVMAVVGVFGVS